MSPWRTEMLIEIPSNENSKHGGSLNNEFSNQVFFMGNKGGIKIEDCS